MGWHFRHADSFTASLHGDINGDLYMQSNNRCYRLQKSLYGLKLSPHFWHDKLASKFKKFGYKQLESSECIIKFKYEMNEKSI